MLCKEILATIPTDKKVGQMNNGVEPIVKARANSYGRDLVQLNRLWVLVERVSPYTLGVGLHVTTVNNYFKLLHLS